MNPLSTKSDFNVEVVRVANVRKHLNADTLSIATVNGVDTVFKTGEFMEGVLAIHVPVDALVPLEHKAFAFLASKSHPERTHARIRAMKLRGIYSEGLLLPITAYGHGWSALKLGDNVQEQMKIRKHETAADRAETGLAPLPNSRRTLLKKFNENIPIYGMDSLVRMAYTVQPHTKMVATEKIHGSNARFVWYDNRFWVGSHRVLRQVSSHRLVEWLKSFWRKVSPNGFYKDSLGDIWTKVAKDFGLEASCKQIPNHVIYGEIYGKGVQTRGGVAFSYDAPDGVLCFRVFDIYDIKNKEFLAYSEMLAVCDHLGLAVVPHVGSVDFQHVSELEPITLGKSKLTNEHMREGIVVRSDIFQRDKNRNLLKLVSKDYKMLENKAD